MISPSDMLQRVGGGRAVNAVAFAKAVCAYFVAGGAPTPSGAALKCAPVLCLLLCVLLSAPRGRYSASVGVGLALSATGDALLVWAGEGEGQAWFVRGMAAFAVAHVAYIAAFGFRPLSLGVGAVLALAAAMFTGGVLRPPPQLAPLVHGYAQLLAVMAWRGVVHGGTARVGALLFLLSDAILGYSLFGGPVPYRKVLVMSTYYSGQLGIALSALDSPARAPHDTSNHRAALPPRC